MAHDTVTENATKSLYNRVLELSPTGHFITSDYSMDIYAGMAQDANRNNKQKRTHAEILSKNLNMHGAQQQSQWSNYSMVLGGGVAPAVNNAAAQNHNKYCHFCQHEKKKRLDSMYACKTKNCSRCVSVSVCACWCVLVGAACMCTRASSRCVSVCLSVCWCSVCMLLSVLVAISVSMRKRRDWTACTRARPSIAPGVCLSVCRCCVCVFIEAACMY
jgi:hypothetical protein